ncbi:MliC family protein [Halomonas piscis]|uniref:MliC family protein n=1 Tax=Halomonas piscis TaxID=3031727 RepID=A0ABY9Z1L9_9GAMM|nr:MliC family protein [Halomonas piscis]WNK20787.1 MliC family protein [Halomonas piscis]
MGTYRDFWPAAVAGALLVGGCAAPGTMPSESPSAGAGEPADHAADTSLGADVSTAPLFPPALFPGAAEGFEAWRCAPANQHLVTAFGDEQLRLWSLHGAWQLPQAVVASGARYQNGELSFWNRGDKAQVETPRGQLQCQLAHERDARTRAEHPGVMFFGHGNEPGWTVELDNHEPRLVLTTDYGETAQTLPYMVSTMDNDAGRVVLENADAGRFFRVRIEAAACFDDMSGKPYPARVTLSIDGEQYSGCGEGIAP